MAQFLGKKKVIDNTMCVLIFSTLFVWNFSHSPRYDHKCSCKVPAILVRF